LRGGDYLTRGVEEKSRVLGAVVLRRFVYVEKRGRKGKNKM